MDNREELLSQLEDILFEVQYAKLGLKQAARTKAANLILDAIETAYKLNAKNKKKPPQTN